MPLPLPIHWLTRGPDSLKSRRTCGLCLHGEQEHRTTRATRSSSVDTDAPPAVARASSFATTSRAQGRAINAAMALHQWENTNPQDEAPPAGPPLAAVASPRARKMSPSIVATWMKERDREEDAADNGSRAQPAVVLSPPLHRVEGSSAQSTLRSPARRPPEEHARRRVVELPRDWMQLASSGVGGGELSREQRVGNRRLRALELLQRGRVMGIIPGPPRDLGARLDELHTRMALRKQARLNDEAVRVAADLDLFLESLVPDAPSELADLSLVLEELASVSAAPTTRARSSSGVAAVDLSRTSSDSSSSDEPLPTSPAAAPDAEPAPRVVHWVPGSPALTRNTSATRVGTGRTPTALDPLPSRARPLKSATLRAKKSTDSRSLFTSSGGDAEPTSPKSPASLFRRQQSTDVHASDGVELASPKTAKSLFRRQQSTDVHVARASGTDDVGTLRGRFRRQHSELPASSVTAAAAPSSAPAHDHGIFDSAKLTLRRVRDAVGRAPRAKTVREVARWEFSFFFTKCTATALRGCTRSAARGTRQCGARFPCEGPSGHDAGGLAAVLRTGHPCRVCGASHAGRRAPHTLPAWHD